MFFQVIDHSACYYFIDLRELYTLLCGGVSFGRCFGAGFALQPSLGH